MLSYEICKRLTDAGFKCPCERNFYIDSTGKGIFVDYANKPDRNMRELVLPSPSLEELLDEIEKWGYGWKLAHTNRDRYVCWCDKEKDGIISAVAIGQGDTAIDAAAELWLKLKEVQDA